MRERVYEFRLGDRKVELALPEEQVIQVIEGRAFPPVDDVAAAVREALARPIGSPTLREIVRPGEKVAIVVSDIARAWVKSDQFLPVLLDELNACGVPDDDVFIVIGRGAHRAHTAEENILVCGQEACRRVAIHQHDCHDESELAYVGKTSRGVETYINKRFYKADRRILTGGITYHYMAGFGGGRKSIMPGICGFDTIHGNHYFFMNREAGQGLNPGCASGALDSNDMHLDMCEMAAMAKPDFLLNAVHTPDGKFAQFVAGHWYTAWKAGTELLKEIYGVPVRAQADLVIASAGGYPKDISLYQGTKTIINAAMACRPGGVIICTLECRDGFGPEGFSGWFKYKDPEALEAAIRNHRCFAAAGMYYLSFPAYMCIDIARRFQLIVVTKAENVDFINKTGMTAVTGLDEAYAIAREKLGAKEFNIAVMPGAADTIPNLQINW